METTELKEVSIGNRQWNIFLARRKDKKFSRAYNVECVRAPVLMVNIWNLLQGVSLQCSEMD